MPKYMFIYHGGKGPETPEEGQRVIAAWGAWMQGLGGNLVDGGNPAGPSMTLTTSGAQEGGGANPVSGYSLVQADSMDHAMELGKDCPIFLTDGASIEIAEAMDM